MKNNFIDQYRVKIMVAKDRSDYNEVRRLQQLLDKQLELNKIGDR